MPLLPPTPARLVPSLLSARGLEVGLKRIHSSLRIGAIPGTFDQGRWTMAAEDVDAAERYFRAIAAQGAHRGGAAALEQAKRRPR